MTTARSVVHQHARRWLVFALIGALLATATVTSEAAHADEPDASASASGWLEFELTRNERENGLTRWAGKLRGNVAGYCAERGCITDFEYLSTNGEVRVWLPEPDHWYAPRFSSGTTSIDSFAYGATTHTGLLVRAVVIDRSNFRPNGIRPPLHQQHRLVSPWVSLDEDLLGGSSDELDSYLERLEGVDVAATLCLTRTVIHSDIRVRSSAKGAATCTAIAVTGGTIAVVAVLLALGVLDDALDEMEPDDWQPAGPGTSVPPGQSQRPLPPPGHGRPGGPPPPEGSTDEDVLAGIVESLLLRHAATVQLDPAAARVIAQECLEMVSWVTARGVDLQGSDCENSNIFVPAFDVQQAAQHKREALGRHPEWFQLNHVDGSERAADQVASGWYDGVYPCNVIGDGLDCDEYPYYSTAQSGPGASLKTISATHNRREGGFLNDFYNTCALQSGVAVAHGGDPFSGDPFLVLPMPDEISRTVYFCEAPVDRGPDLPT